MSKGYYKRVRTHESEMTAIRQILFYLFLLFVVLTPLPLGSNREWAWTLNAVLVSVFSLIWVVTSLQRPRSISLSLNPLIIVMFLLVCVWTFMQAAEWTPVSWHHPVWVMTVDTLAKELPGRVSVSMDDTFTAIMRLMSYALVFFLSFQYGRSSERAYQTLRTLALAGLAYAVYGLVSYWSGNGDLLWFTDNAFKTDVRSTFVNRNSYATYAGLTLLCTMAWFYQSIVFRRSDRLYEMPRGRQMRTEEFILKTWKPLIAILLMSTALILTHSRGGFISTVAGGLVLLWALNHRQQIKNTRSRAVVISAIFVAVLAFVLSSEVLLERLDRIDMDGSGRMIVYEQVRNSIVQGDIRGMGYGTFADSFRMYRGAELMGHYDKAHNTYLENIFELGWAAALLLFSVIGWLGLICLRGVRERGRDWVYPAVGLAATVLVGVHALLDFSLQMPAVAIAYACILGVGCAQSSSTGRY